MLGTFTKTNSYVLFRDDKFENFSSPKSDISSKAQNLHLKSINSNCENNQDQDLISTTLKSK
jgi:hypothetical protein